MKLVLILTFFAMSMAYGQSQPKKIVIIGDSLTEGYGVDKSFSYPSVLQEKFDKLGKKVKIINGGVSGSTTASGKSRLKWFMRVKPDIVVFALGANDGLRGIKLEQTRSNLEDLVKMAQEKKVKVVLAGMRIPPNYGKEYTAGFYKIFTEISKKYNTSLIPFLLEGVAGNKDLNIEDGIHPNRKGYVIIAETVYKTLKDLI